MIHKTILAIITAAVLVGAFVAFTPLQAFAATKTFSSHQANMPLSLDLGLVCNSNDNIFTGRANVDFTMWDNNKADIHIAEQGLLTDSITGDKVGEVSAEETINNQPTDGLPSTIQLNIQGTCDGSGATSVFTIHEGVTVDQNGGIHIHI